MVKGDTAVIIRSDSGNDGVVVVLGKFLGKVEGFIGDDRWEVDVPLISTIVYRGNDDNVKELDVVNHVGGWQLDPIVEEVEPVFVEAYVDV